MSIRSKSDEFLKPFGPVVLKTYVSEKFLGVVNAAADCVLHDEILSQKQNYANRLAGNVHKEIIPLYANLKEEKLVLNEIINKSFEYLRFFYPKISEHRKTDLLEIRNHWVVSQKSGDFNPVHIHGGNISGVVYLKVPGNLKEELAKEDHYPRVGKIEFFDGRRVEFSRNSFCASPETGLTFVFPSWLPHVVYPFRSSGERRSLSFNINFVPHGGETKAGKLNETEGQF